MSTILITGGLGFIGYHLALRLCEDKRNSVLIVDDASRGQFDAAAEKLQALDNCEILEHNLCVPGLAAKLPKRIDYIYHLAAVIGVKNVLRSPDRVLAVNAQSTLNLLDYCRHLVGLKRVLFSSTSEIYAGTAKHFEVEHPTPETVAIAVDDISSARSSYAVSKLFCESAFFNYGKVHEVPFTIARYHNVYGPRMGFAHVIPEMIAKISKNSQISVASPKHSRAFCYIDDAVSYTIKLCESDNTRAEIFNVGNASEEIRVLELTKRIARVMGKKTEFMSGTDTPGSPSRRCPDTTKLVAATEYLPTTDLDTGLSLTYEWYKERLDSASLRENADG